MDCGKLKARAPAPPPDIQDSQALCMMRLLGGIAPAVAGAPPGVVAGDTRSPFTDSRRERV